MCTGEGEGAQEGREKEGRSACAGKGRDDGMVLRDGFNPYAEESVCAGKGTGKRNEEEGTTAQEEAVWCY